MERDEATGTSMSVGDWRHHRIRSEVLWTYALTMRENSNGEVDLQLGIVEACIELVEWFDPDEGQAPPDDDAAIHVDHAHRKVRVFGHPLRDESVDVWVYRIR